MSRLSSKIGRGKRREIWFRDNGRCVYCSRPVRVRPRRASKWLERDDDFSLDHVIPKVHGGTDDSANLVTACRKCNNAKAALEKEVFLAIIQRPPKQKARRIRGVAFVPIPAGVVEQTERLIPHPSQQTIADTKFILTHGYKAWREQFEQPQTER